MVAGPGCVGRITTCTVGVGRCDLELPSALDATYLVLADDHTDSSALTKRGNARPSWFPPNQEIVFRNSLAASKNASYASSDAFSRSSSAAA